MIQRWLSLIKYKLMQIDRKSVQTHYKIDIDLLIAVDLMQIKIWRRYIMVCNECCSIFVILSYLIRTVYAGSVSYSKYKHFIFLILSYHY